VQRSIDILVLCATWGNNDVQIGGRAHSVVDRPDARCSEITEGIVSQVERDPVSTYDDAVKHGKQRRALCPAIEALDLCCTYGSRRDQSGQGVG